MTFYEQVLRDLIQGFKFFAVDPATDEKVYLEVEELMDRRGLLAQLILHTGHYLQSLELSGSLVEAVADLGVCITSSDDGMMGIVAHVGELNAPISLALTLSTHSLLSQIGSEYENDTPRDGAEINISGLFSDSAALLSRYLNEFNNLHVHLSDVKKAHIKQLADQGDPAASLLLAQLLRIEPDFVPAPAPASGEAPTHRSAVMSRPQPASSQDVPAPDSSVEASPPSGPSGSASPGTGTPQK